MCLCFTPSCQTPRSISCSFSFSWNPPLICHRSTRLQHSSLGLIMLYAHLLGIHIHPSPIPPTDLVEPDNNDCHLCLSGMRLKVDHRASVLDQTNLMALLSYTMARDDEEEQQDPSRDSPMTCREEWLRNVQEEKTPTSQQLSLPKGLIF